MLPALLVLTLAALAPAAARRHAPYLREDEPARRTARTAGECISNAAKDNHPMLPRHLCIHRCTTTNLQQCTFKQAALITLRIERHARKDAHVCLCM